MHKQGPWLLSASFLLAALWLFSSHTQWGACLSPGQTSRAYPLREELEGDGFPSKNNKIPSNSSPGFAVGLPAVSYTLILPVCNPKSERGRSALNIQ